MSKLKELKMLYKNTLKNYKKMIIHVESSNEYPRSTSLSFLEKRIEQLHLNAKKENQDILDKLYYIYIYNILLILIIFKLLVVHQC